MRGGAQNPEGSKSIRLVVADDHLILLESLAALLDAQPDFEVVGKACNGTQAVRMVEQHHPDVLVLDLLMPEGNGFDVLRAMERTRNRVPAVVLTGSANQLDYVQAVKLGARGLVLKGDVPERLFAAIRAVRNGELAFSSDIADQVIHSIAAEPLPVPPSNLARLSERERQITMLISQGLKNKDIAQNLHISENTVKRHLQSIFNKTKTRDRLELAVLAVAEFSRAA